MKHFAQNRPGSSMPDFMYESLGDGSTPHSQGSDPSGKGKQVALDATPAQSEGEINAEVNLSIFPYIPPYTISEPQSSPNTSPNSPTLSESGPPKDPSSMREPFSDDCQFLYISDSEPEEEGLAPRHVYKKISEPEEEQRRHFIRQFESARVKIPLRTSEPEYECPVPLSVIDEFDFLTKEQRAEALEEQRRRDEMNESLKLAKRLQKQEYLKRWVKEKNEEQSERLAEELAEKELRRDNLKINPVKAQEKILQMLLKENQEPQDEDLVWCNKRLNHRISEAKITNISVEGHSSKKGLRVFFVISRGGVKEERDQAQFLKFYGYTEWLEIREVLQRSRSKFKGIVEDIINELLQRMSKHVEVPPLPEKTRRRKAKTDDIESGSSSKNEHETKFDYMTLLGHLEIPDVSMLNTSLPEARQYYEHEIVSHPEAGMVFLDNDGLLKFFRNREVRKAPSKLIRLMYYQCWANNDPMKFQKYIYEKELRRREEEL